MFTRKDWHMDRCFDLDRKQAMRIMEQKDFKNYAAWFRKADAHEILTAALIAGGIGLLAYAVWTDPQYRQATQKTGADYMQTTR